MSLAAEVPAEAIAADEALLDASQPGQPPRVRWWTPASPAVVVGLGLRHRLTQIVDLDRCATAGVAVLERRAGGGALLLDEHMICGAISVSLPDARVGTDITESYRWLGDLFVRTLAETIGLSAKRVAVDAARADVAALRARTDPIGPLILGTCYGALSPHEVAIGRAKLIGIAQVRRRQACLFQFGLLLRDQSPLAAFLRVTHDHDENDDEHGARLALADELRRRTAGVPLSRAEVLRWLVAVEAAIPDAEPAAPGRPARP